MPMQIEHEGQTITVYTQDELDQEVKGLKVTNGNLKAEKTEAEDKLKELKASVQDFEVQLAEAQGDKDKAERLMQEIKDAKEAEHKELLNTIKNKEVQAVINGLVTKHGAGGTKNEDLQDLLKSRFSFDYDIKDGKVKVSGNGVSSFEELSKLVAEDERYAGYRAGSGSAGGGSTGDNGAGVTAKKLSEMTATEEALFAKENPEQYAKLIQ